MKVNLVLTGLILLLFHAHLAAQTGNPPTPVPPPDDDLPIFIRMDDADIVADGMKRLCEDQPALALFDRGGRLLSAASRSFSRHQVKNCITDFLFYMGPAETAGWGRFVVVKVQCIHSLQGGSRKWIINRSNELLLEKAVPMPLTSCLADNAASLKACYSVLQDAAVQGLTRDLLPYYRCQAVLTPISEAPYPQDPITVTLQFVNAKNADDRINIQVDYLEDIGPYNVKDGSGDQGKGGSHDQ